MSEVTTKQAAHKAPPTTQDFEGERRRLAAAAKQAHEGIHSAAQSIVDTVGGHQGRGESFLRGAMSLIKSGGADDAKAALDLVQLAIDGMSDCAMDVATLARSIESGLADIRS